MAHPLLGPLDRRVTIERKSVARDPDFKSEQITWVPLVTVYASVDDVADTGRGGSEVVRDKERVQITRTKVRMRYRSDLTSDMRVVLIDRTRTLQITGIAELGRRVGTALTCEQFST